MKNIFGSNIGHVYEYFKEVLFVTLVLVTICMNEGAKSNIWASDTSAVFSARPDDILFGDRTCKMFSCDHQWFHKCLSNIRV